jgi:di/tricarboxylate transporter
MKVMPTDLIAGAVLIAVFVLGTLTKVNIGALAIVASFLFGTLWLGEDIPTIFSGFPASFFVLIVGVTYLFSVASANGTMEWLLGWTTRLVGGRAIVLPFALFVAAAAISSFGAPAQAGVALLAPLGLRLSGRLGLSPFVAGIAVVLGVLGGSFSPLNILALVANGSLRDAGLPVAELPLFLASIATYGVALVAVVLFYQLVVRRRVAVATGGAVDSAPGPISRRFGARRTMSAPVTAGHDAAATDLRGDAAPRISLPTVATLIGILVVLVGSMVFQLDLGFLALTVAVVLHLLIPRDDATKYIAWDVTLLITGLVMYIAVLERAGTMDRVGDALVAADAPMLAIYLICIAAALISAFASSTATLGASMALVTPLVVDGGIGVVAATVAVCVSATLVDASPFSSVGALTIAAAPREQTRRLYKQFLAWGLSMIVVGPTVVCALFIWLPGLFGG